MNRFMRILKHRWLDERDSYRALNAEAVSRIEQRVKASERQHSGEIRVCVEAGLPLSYLWRGLTAHDRALTMFGKLRVWDTEANNGVLIYLLLADHAIEIVADRGLNPHASRTQWQAMVAHMGEAFRAGRFEQGLAEAVDKVDAVLRQHFPLARDAADSNELADRPHLM